MEDQAIWGDVKFNKDEDDSVKSRCNSFKEEFICYFVTRLGEFETESRSSKLGLLLGEGKEGKWQKISTAVLTEGASAAAIAAGKFRVLVSTGAKCINLLIKLGFKVNHQKKAKVNTEEFAISERSLLSCLSEAATELSHIYEYQISMIKNPNDVKVLAQHAADCIFSYCNEQTKDEENNRVGFLITGVIKGTSDKDNKTSQLETRCGPKWILASIFKKPSLIKQLPFGSTENKFSCVLYKLYSPNDADAKPEKYGYRKQALCIDDESDVYRVMEYDRTDLCKEDPEDFKHQLVMKNNPPVFVRVDYSDVKNYCEKTTNESFNDYIKSIIHGHQDHTVVSCLRPMKSFNENAKIELRKIADFSNCDLTRLEGDFFDVQTPVSDADSTDAESAKLCFKGANLFKANLSGKDLSGVELQGADLSFGNYENTDFSRAILLKTYITYSEVNGANFNKDDYQNVACVDLQGSNIKDATFFNQLQSVDDKASKLLEKQEEGLSQMTQGMKTLQEGIHKLIQEDKKGESDEETLEEGSHLEEDGELNGEYRKVRTRMLNVLGGELTSYWQNFLRYCGEFDYDEVNIIEKKIISKHMFCLEEQARAAVKAWKTKGKKTLTYSSLITTLGLIEKQDIADKIQGILDENSISPETKLY